MGHPSSQPEYSLSDFALAPLSPRHSIELAELEQRTNSPPWSERLFLDEFSLEYSMNFGAFLETTLAGFIFFHHVADQGHIVNLAVDPPFQGIKLGRTLLLESLRALEQRHASSVVLEVRESNVVARNLYESIGFRVLGARPRYYRNNGEDALLMKIEVEEFQSKL